jgi:hypothetical protein
MNGDLDEFHRGRVWGEWWSDISTFAGDQAFLFYPPLWAKGSDINSPKRRAIPSRELIGLMGPFGTASSAQAIE